MFAQIGADVDAYRIADYGVAEDRLGAFGTGVLDEMGLSRKIRIMRGAWIAVVCLEGDS